MMPSWSIFSFVFYAFSIIVLGNLSSDFLEMTILIIKVGILIQIRIWVGSETFLIMGLKRG